MHVHSLSSRIRDRCSPGLVGKKLEDKDLLTLARNYFFVWNELILEPFFVTLDILVGQEHINVAHAAQAAKMFGGPPLKQNLCPGWHHQEKRELLCISHITHK